MLTERELTERAATKVMGWKPYGVPLHGWRTSDGGGRPVGYWQPLTDIRAAWEIVEKMRAEGWVSECQIHPAYPRDKDSDRWMFRKCGALTGDSLWVSGVGRAITIAALLAVGAVTESELK